MDTLRKTALYDNENEPLLCSFDNYPNLSEEEANYLIDMLWQGDYTLEDQLKAFAQPHEIIMTLISKATDYSISNEDEPTEEEVLDFIKGTHPTDYTYGAFMIEMATRIGMYASSDIYYQLKLEEKEEAPNNKTKFKAEIDEIAAKMGQAMFKITNKSYLN